MKNPYYRQVERQENRLSERNSHYLGDNYVNALGLTMFSESTEIQIQKIQVAEINNNNRKSDF